MVFIRSKHEQLKKTSNGTLFLIQGVLWFIYVVDVRNFKKATKRHSLFDLESFARFVYVLKVKTLKKTPNDILCSIYIFHRFHKLKLNVGKL